MTCEHFRIGTNSSPGQPAVVLHCRNCEFSKTQDIRSIADMDTVEIAFNKETDCKYDENRQPCS